MCYSIFSILMEVTIVMQMSKGCLECIQIPQHRIPESLEYVFEPSYYTLLHKGVSVCALFIPSDIFRYACIYLKTNRMTKQIQFKTLSSVQTQDPASVSFSASLLCLSLFFVLLSFSEGGDGSCTVCCIMALTAYDINAVCSDLTVSGKWLFPVVVLQ